MEKPPHASAALGFFAVLLRRSTLPTLTFVILSLFSNLLMLTGPLFMLQIYDRVLASRSMPTLVALTGLVIAIYAFYAVIEQLRARMTARFGLLVDEALSKEVLKSAIRLRLQPAGQMSDPVRDLDTLRMFVGGMGPSTLLDLPWVPIYIAIVYAFHPVLGWVTICGAAIITLLLFVNEVGSQSASRRLTAEALRRQQSSEDARQNAEAVVAMGMLQSVADRFSKVGDIYNETLQRASDQSAFFASLTKSIRLLLQSLVLATGAFLVIEGQVNAGIMIAASIITSRALAPVEQMVSQWRGFVTARQAAGRTFTLLKAMQTNKRDTELPAPTATFSTNNLATGPEPGKRPVVQGVTIELKAGEGLGILGPSGAGKSSLVRALVGVWPTMFGDIRFDGSEIGHYDQEALGQSIGYLPQSVELFNGTIAENIARFRPQATSGEILRAAELASVHGLITSLPDGYDTKVGDRGTVLSAGQRQRIGLARALFGDPFLIALDEPNSNLDQEGDVALTAAIDGARKRGAIVLVVAHRPSAIAAVNKLLFMQNGRQVMFGKKEDVLQKIAPTNLRVLEQQREASGTHGA